VYIITGTEITVSIKPVCKHLYFNPLSVLTVALRNSCWRS